MGIGRTLFLWASRNQTLRERLPRYGFVKKSVMHFMPGETIEDALKEVESYYSGPSNQCWLQYSWLIFLDNELAGACLVDFWHERNVPLIAYIMTAPRWKGKHLATAALLCSLQKLADKNHTEVRTVITEGNVPSEKIFTRIGFKRLHSD